MTIPSRPLTAMHAREVDLQPLSMLSRACRLSSLDHRTFRVTAQGSGARGASHWADGGSRIGHGA